MDAGAGDTAAAPACLSLDVIVEANAAALLTTAGSAGAAVEAEVLLPDAEGALPLDFSIEELNAPVLGLEAASNRATDTHTCKLASYQYQLITSSTRKQMQQNIKKVGLL